MTQNDVSATKYDFPSVGCYVDESSGNAIEGCERTIDFAVEYGFNAGESLPDEDHEDYPHIVDEVADEAVDFLNDLETRDYMYWTVEDNSLLLMPDVDSAREDVEFVSHDDREGDETCNPDDPAYPCDVYEGLWLHVNDHGNCTLYNRVNGVDTEIWAVV